MQSLKNFKNEELSSLTTFVGGGNETKWKQGERSGKDTYTDENGDNKYNDGECVKLDDGRTIDC